MKYDDASWHYGGDFPSDLPVEAGATHIGMFVAWCLLNGLAGTIHIDEFPDHLESLRSRRVTPGQFVIEACDEKFIDEDLTDEGNRFAVAYFDGQYPSDYDETLGRGMPTTYHIEDSWKNYDELAPVITQRFEDWKDGKLTTLEEKKEFDLGGIVDKKPWWKFW